MSQLVMPRREFAGVPGTVTTVTLPPKPDQPRHIVALGWISGSGGKVTISDRPIGSVATPAGR